MMASFTGIIHCRQTAGRAENNYNKYNQRKCLHGENSLTNEPQKLGLPQRWVLFQWRNAARSRLFLQCLRKKSGGTARHSRNRMGAVELVLQTAGHTLSPLAPSRPRLKPRRVTQGFRFSDAHSGGNRTSAWDLIQCRPPLAPVGR
jgi:hypothetical protein